MWSDLLFRIRAIFRRNRVEQELDEELRFHLDRQVEKHLQTGGAREEAARRARLDFGGLDQVKEEARDARGVFALDIAWRDLRYGLRVLLKSPAFTAVAVLSLALGIGANTAIFQLVDAVRLRTLPVKDPQDLAEVSFTGRMEDARGNFQRGFSALSNPVWEQIRARQGAFSGAFAWADERFNIAPSGEARFGYGLWVSGDLFPVLGVEPILGRLFTAADDRRGCGVPGAVISYAFWKREFGGEASALGRKVWINAHPVEVIGVTPASFYGLDVGQIFDIALPICSEAALRGPSTHLDDGTTWWLTVMGRRKPGWSIEQASANLRAISAAVFAASLAPNYPPVSVKGYLAFQLQALPAGTGVSGLREQYSNPLWLLLSIAGLVLLIACANLANLMLARASAREREIAVRLAIGASRPRLIGQLLAESLLIAFAGAGLGLFLAPNLSRLLVSLLRTEGSSIFVDLHQDWRVLAFTALLAILTCLLFGLAPALRATRRSPGEVLKAGSRGMTAGRERFGLRRVLVVSQVALSLVLLVGALLFVRSLHNLLTVQTGFRQDGILITGLSFARLDLPPDRRLALKRTVVERLRSVPGVDAAADVTNVPIGGSGTDNRVWLEGSDEAHGKVSLFNKVGTDYFKTLGSSLLLGRDFDDRDTVASLKVAIVNEAWVNRFTASGNPLGKRFWVEATPSTPETLYEIVGLVHNMKYNELRQDFMPVIYMPMSQDPGPSLGDQLIIHARIPLDSLVPSVRRALEEVNPGIRYSFRVFKTEIYNSLLRERLMAILSSCFGALAGLLSAIGLYGVISYMVARRRNEIGIRMALGACRREILAMVLRESAMLLGAGLLAGTVVSLAAATTASALLYGLKPYDAPTFLMAAATLALVALAASYLPARRAARLDPTVALRDE